MNCDINQENITRLFAWFVPIGFYKYCEENIDLQPMCSGCSLLMPEEIIRLFDPAGTISAPNSLQQSRLFILEVLSPEIAQVFQINYFSVVEKHMNQSIYRFQLISCIYFANFIQEQIQFCLNILKYYLKVEQTLDQLRCILCLVDLQNGIGA